LSSELIINATQNENRIALLKDRKLIEFHHDHEGSQFKVGDIFLGTVKKVVQGLNASFIDIGHEKDAFLHYLDLGPQFNSLGKYTKVMQTRKNVSSKLDKFRNEPDINKFGKISQVLSKNRQILVQVVKEPISTKGPRLSSELSIAGRYLILVPFSNAVSISRKITSGDERKRLLRLMSSIKPANFGVIIRTVAEGKDVAELDSDLRNLLNIWENGIKTLRTAKPREKIIGEMSMASSLLRDVLNESFDNIIIDDNKVFEEVKSYTKQIAPEKEKIVKIYNGRAKIFENFGIEKQLKTLFGTTVSLKGGGYLIIEHTEALHVIDVNSGNKSNREDSQETTAFSVNLEAAIEVARQLRLRDMGGIVVIDFIDMRKAANRKMVYEKVKEEMNSERSKFTVLPLSKFGLMQITRQRVRPEMSIVTQENCPSCNGTGKIGASILVSDEIEKNIDFIFSKQNEKRISISVHPYLYAYFTKGLPSRQQKWFLKYNKWVKLVEDSSLAIMAFEIHNLQGEKIQV
jgi:ribonuclease G